MVVFLLGLIAAALLFGAAAVRNVLAGLLGVVALAACLAYAMSVPGVVWLGLLGTVITGGIAFGLWLVIDQQRSEKDRLMEDCRANGLSGEPVAQVLTKFRNSGEPAARRLLKELIAGAADKPSPPTGAIAADPGRRLMSGGYKDR